MQHNKEILKSLSCKKGVNLILTLIMILSLSITGCGEKKDSKKKKETPIESSTLSNISDDAESVEPKGEDFDFSQVFDNIEINGTKVSMPFTLNDLGEGYEFKVPVDHGDGTFYITLYYNGTEIGGASIIAESEEKIGNDSPIYRLELYSHLSKNFKINGISFDSDISEIEKAFVNIPVHYNKDGEEMGYAVRTNNNIFDIFINNEKIELITIIKGDELHD